MKKRTYTVQDRDGDAVVGAEVYVRKQSDNTLVSLFSDDGSTATANPTVTDNDGEYSYYTADNVLKEQVYVDGVEQNEVNHIQHYDLSAISAFIWTLLDDADAAAARATLEIEVGTDVQAYDAELTQIAGLADPNADRILFWDDSAGSYAYLAPSTGIVISTTNLAIDEATAANYRANTADKVMTTDAAWSSAASVVLTPGTNVSVDMSSGFNFSLAMGGNYTLDNFTNGKAGQTGCIEITQDGTGSRTLAYGTAYKFAGGTDPVLTTTATAKDLLFYQVLADGTTAYGTLVKAVA